MAISLTFLSQGGKKVLFSRMSAHSRRYLKILVHYLGLGFYRLVSSCRSDKGKVAISEVVRGY